MAGFSTELERNVRLALGTKAFGPFLIDDDVRAVKISFDRSQWTDPDARLDVSLEVSVAGGDFTYLTGFTASGGPVNPNKPPFSSIRVNLPDGTTRRVQGTYAVSGQRFRTTVVIEADTVGLRS